MLKEQVRRTRVMGNDEHRDGAQCEAGSAVKLWAETGPGDTGLLPTEAMTGGRGLLATRRAGERGQIEQKEPPWPLEFTRCRKKTSFHLGHFCLCYRW